MWVRTLFCYFSISDIVHNVICHFVVFPYHLPPSKPMKVLTCSELLNLHRTTFAMKSGNGADSVFSDLNSGAVLVIEGAEILFRDGYGHDNIINYLLFQIRRVTTMFIFICQGTVCFFYLCSSDSILYLVI